MYNLYIYIYIFLKIIFMRYKTIRYSLYTFKHTEFVHDNIIISFTKKIFKQTNKQNINKNNITAEYDE